ncbi:MAG: hypothetical protein R3D85_12015 [Paracoccaceae bacterium]
MLRLLLPLALLAALPLRADPLPQGDFMLGTYIWPDTLLPRYVELQTADDRIDITLSSALPLDFKACDDDGDCLFSTHAATLRGTVEDGKLVISDTQMDPDAVIDPSAQQHAGLPDWALYTGSLVTRLHGASYAATDFGFTLTSGGTTLAFYRGDAAAFAAARAIPIIFELSIVQMAHCEVRSIVPLLQGAPTDDTRRFRNTLGVLARQVDMQNMARALSPLDQASDATNRPRSKHALIDARLPSLIAGLTSDLEPPYADAFWDQLGATLFRDNRAAYDMAIDGYGLALDDAVAFYRHLRAHVAEISAETVCADPSFGFR